MITARGLSLGYGGHPVVNHLDLSVGPGRVVALVGGDGAGKTTVLRALSGRLRPLSGELALPSPDAVGVVPERGAVFDDLTVAENLAFVRAAHGRSAAGPGDPMTARVLARTGLTPFTDRLGGALSGGMRQKLALAMALQHRPDVLLLDEPTSGVDPVSRAELWRLLSEEVAQDTGVVLATTYLDEAARASEVVVLEGGRVLEQGSAAAICARTPGVIIAGDQPIGRHAWRRGRTWHSWLTDHDDGADHTGAITPDLEDAVVVASLADELSHELADEEAA